MASPVLETYSSNTAASSSVVVTKPTGLTAGDLMVAIIGAQSASGSPTVDTPSGWTLKAHDEQTGNNTATGVVYKIASAGDAAAANFTFSATSGTKIVCLMVRISGHSPDIPLSGGQITYNGTTFSVSPGTADALLILAGIQSTSAGSGWSGYTISGTNPAWTEIYDAASQLYMGVAWANANSVSTITSADVLDGGANDEYRILVSVAETVNGAVTLDAVALNATPNDPSLRMDGAVTLDAVALSASVQDVTAIEPTPVWTNEPKYNATNVVNIPKT